MSQYIAKHWLTDEHKLEIAAYVLHVIGYTVWRDAFDPAWDSKKQQELQSKLKEAVADAFGTVEHRIFMREQETKKDETN